MTDAACNTGRYPIVMPPPPGTTHTGVTVRYLAAEPPLRPVAAGSSATVYVDARHQPLPLGAAPCRHASRSSARARRRASR